MKDTTKKNKISIMLIEDEEFDVIRVRNTLNYYQQYITITDVFSDGRTALSRLAEKPGRYDVIIMDFQISGGIFGERLIKEIKSLYPEIQIIVITKMTINITDFEFANSLLEAGAIWYCTKYPGDIEEYIYQPTDFILSIFNAYERKKLESKRLQNEIKLNQNIEKILVQKKIVGESEIMQKIREQIEVFAQTHSTVLIRGDSGTGKELIAERIHYYSDRKFENFIPINCGSIPETLIESEFFGYVKGAFTGANQDKPGLFELAHQGTIFLDEVAELPAAAQVKLLRVIQEGEIEKIGRKKKIEVDVRIIAATNKNIEQLIVDKLFREDLYYRLNVLNINIPNLSERQEDIIPLFNYYLKKYSLDMNRKIPFLSGEIKNFLVAHPWKGNIRELQNVVQRILLFSGPEIGLKQIQEAIGTKDLSQFSLDQQNFADEDFEMGFVTLKEFETKMKKKYIQNIRKHCGSDSETAKILGLPPSNFYRTCKKLGLK